MLQDELHNLDLIDESTGLSEEEVCKRNETAAKLMLQLKNRKSLLAQKVKMQWLRDGDVNNKLFQKSINARRRQNDLAGLEINEVWIEELRLVKKAVKEHFQEQFKGQKMGRITLPSDFTELKLDTDEELTLTRAFDEEELKQAVWDLGGDKSPGPDSFNFEFYRNCWGIIKDDLLRVLNEFHSNCKFSKGCNSSFIVLLPKKVGACALNNSDPCH